MTNEGMSPQEFGTGEVEPAVDPVDDTPLDNVAHHQAALAYLSHLTQQYVGPGTKRNFDIGGDHPTAYDFAVYLMQDICGCILKPYNEGIHPALVEKYPESNLLTVHAPNSCFKGAL